MNRLCGIKLNEQEYKRTIPMMLHLEDESSFCDSPYFPLFGKADLSLYLKPLQKPEVRM